MTKFIISSDGESVTVEGPDARHVWHVPVDAKSLDEAERLACWWVIRQSLSLIEKGEVVTTINHTRKPTREEKTDEARLLRLFSM